MAVAFHPHAEAIHYPSNVFNCNASISQCFKQEKATSGLVD